MLASWENESTTNPEGIGSSSPDLPVSPSILSPVTSVGGSNGPVARVLAVALGGGNAWEEDSWAQGLARGGGGKEMKCFFV
jgi:hypothetical protein